MPRHARKLSGSGYYHVFIRGINRQQIFMDDSDRRKFLKGLKTIKADSDFKVIAWCLMTNHIHLLLGTNSDSISDIIKRLSCSYVSYFNRKYSRVGPLFQDRFGSEPVESETYFLSVSRYILQNPMKAGIAPTEDYYWSSYREYVGNPFITDCSILLSMINGTDNFIKYMCEKSDEQFLDESAFSSSEEVAECLINDIKSSNPKYFFCETPEKQKELLNKWLGQGIRLQQIAEYLKTPRHRLYYIHKRKG